MTDLSTDVVVVGAGAAGLACAQRLIGAGLEVQVLEATDRVGGRLWTDYSIGRGAPVETGALMVHGRRVATQDWARELRVNVRRLPVLQRSVFFRNHLPSRLPWMALPFHRRFGLHAVIQAGWTIPRRMRRWPAPDIPFDEFLERVRATPGARSLATFLHAHINVADPDEIGTLGTGGEEALSAEGWVHHYQLVEGYSELVRRRALPLRSQIRTRAIVTSIRRTDLGIRVQWNDDSIPCATRARAAVVTLPLGVLKADSVEFDPPLSEPKRRVIGRLGYGSVMETILRLKGGNLVKRLGDCTMLWGNTSTSFDRPFAGLRGRPEILSAFTAGREARRRSQLGDQEAVEASLAELSSFLPSDIRVGEVDGFLIRRWPEDPWIRGGYSFLPPGVTVAERRTLAEPIEGRLFFAGEATHSGGEAASVHGAIETGYRAATEVLRAFRT